MKRCKIRIEHSTYPIFKLTIRPGTKVSDVLSYLNLTEDYVLQLQSDQSLTYTPSEILYDLIENDQKLIATLSPQAVEKANAYIQHLVYGEAPQ